MIERAGVVGDVHCEDRRLASALAFLARAGVDCLLAVGDYADGRGDLDRCVELLAGAGALGVLGNHDRWLLDGTMRDLAHASTAPALREDTRRWLRAQPKTRRLESAAGPLLLCHGLGEEDMAQLRPDHYGSALDANASLQAILQAGDVRVVVGGHTHQRMARRIGEVWFINAGTLHRDYGAGFLLLDLAGRVAQFYDLLDEEEIVAAERCELA